MTSLLLLPVKSGGTGIYNYIYGSTVPTSDPHVWPLITTRHVKCIVQNAEACPVRPCVDICHIQCIWIYVCKGYDWSHKRARLNLVMSSPYVTGTMMVNLHLNLDPFSRTVPYEGRLGKEIICYISFF